VGIEKEMELDWTALIQDIIQGGAKTAIWIFAILVPLMIVLEMIRDARLLDRISAAMSPVMRFLRLPGEATLPITAGFFFGISYGSGIILAFLGDERLSKRDLMLICIFFALCHGMIEDPLVFAAIGASWWILVTVRLALALIFMLVATRLLGRKGEPL
jgi:hypothetical protein